MYIYLQVQDIQRLQRYNQASFGLNFLLVNESVLEATYYVKMITIL